MKIKSFILCVFLPIIIATFALADGFQPPVNGGGGGGSGSVSNVTFTGDGTILSSTPSSAVTTSGTLTATLTNAPANSILGNFTGSSATPTYSASPTFSGVNITSLNAGNISSGTLPVGRGGTGNTTGAPSGGAGGALAGTYPNPVIASGANVTNANITNAYQSGGTLSNVTITGPSYFNPTNVYYEANTYTVANGSATITAVSPANGFLNKHVGDSFGGPGNTQYAIVAIATGGGSATIDPYYIGTLTAGTNYYVSPCAAIFKDDNGNQQGSITGGGQVYVCMAGQPGTGNLANQGIVLAYGGQSADMTLGKGYNNAVVWEIVNAGENYPLGDTAPFNVAVGAPNNSLCVLLDGEVVLFGGITNFNGTSLPFNCSVAFGYPVTGTTQNFSTSSTLNAVTTMSLVVSNGVTISAGSYKQNGLAASVGSTLVYTNTSGGYVDVVLTGTYAITTAASVGTLTTTFTWTNENGQQTYTPLSTLTTAAKASGSIAATSMTLSNTTSVTVATTLVNTSGAAVYDLRAAVSKW